MAKRKDWVVSYVATEVAVAAQKKRVHHEARLAYWSDRRQAAEKDLREKGIVIDEMANPIHSNTVAGPRYDATLMQIHQECAGKVREHREKMATYSAWYRMLTIAGERSQQIDLDVEDVEFFEL